MASKKFTVGLIAALSIVAAVEGVAICGLLASKMPEKVAEPQKVPVAEEKPKPEEQKTEAPVEVEPAGSEDAVVRTEISSVQKKKSPVPYLKFADGGRYLPPGGRRVVRLESLGVSNIVTSIRRVEPRNVVQMLAREEGVYSCCWYGGSADDSGTEELSGECEMGNIVCRAIPDEKEISTIAVKMDDGGPEKGVYLLSARRSDRSWSVRHRLVCLSDLGVSVRKSDDAIGVWVASLMTGKPVEGAVVEVYSTANILLASGAADKNGWCALSAVAKGDPFAVVVRAKDGEDMTFLALRDSMLVDETYEDGARPSYLKPDELDAFLWSDRGIYRHGEKILVHAIVRNGGMKAPRPIPLVLSLKNPSGNVLMRKTVMTDMEGAFSCEDMLVPHEHPSGKWKLQVSLPGDEARTLASREIKVEEFVPPQIRVAVLAEEGQHPTNFTFKVSAEHMFGGPASFLACEGAVVFEDVPFAPARWKGFCFGDDGRGLNPSFRRLEKNALDDKGVFEYAAPLLKESGMPKAAVRVTAQGIAFEDGGRPATARTSTICHYYPFYIGSNLPAWLKLPEEGRAKIHFMCVDHRGILLRERRRLVAMIDRIDTVYACKKNARGMDTWDCDRVRTTVCDSLDIEIGETGFAEVALPLDECGDYALSVRDVESGVSFSRTFYLSSWGDDVVRAPLGNPTEVAIQCDKSTYHVGDVPHLIVKAPFAGYALVSVMRDGCLYSEVLNLTNATTEVALRPVEREWAPNVDVAISVVQSVDANSRRLAARAHGLATLAVKLPEKEIDVGIFSSLERSRLSVDITAENATSAIVTVVDESINMFTGEKTPAPSDWFSRMRGGDHPFFDLYGRILPVLDGGPVASGIKTGGDVDAEMLGRVSPVPTRRFKPLAMWRRNVMIDGGRGHVEFDLPEFAGELRITAVAYSDSATGSASLKRKVAPKLVMQPDAPRFVAPGDRFDLTQTLRNNTDVALDIRYSIRVDEETITNSECRLGGGDATNIFTTVVAPDNPCEMSIGFKAESSQADECHAETILLPVLSPCPWRMVSGFADTEAEARKAARLRPGDRFTCRRWESPLGEFASALEWLADYPHGCLEQTTSRMFPLVHAGGILSSVASGKASNRVEYVSAGVRRVKSMMRANDFVMWPDCDYSPWDREVSLYAAHFLVEAERAGVKLDASTKARTLRYLRKWAMSTNDCESAYACHTLALAEAPERDRMLRLFDNRANLSALSRARLSRAFAAIRDFKRAEELMRHSFEPQSIKEAAFTVLALLDLNADDGRLPGLMEYLSSHRDKTQMSWGTTEDNAHALLAIGAYWSCRPEQASEPFVTWRKLFVPSADEIVDDSNGIFVSRRYLRPDGEVADMDRLVRGELLVAELTITSDVSRVVNDLVIEDLLPGGFEPVHREIVPNEDWLMRKDLRDDRVLVFSKRFKLEKDHEAKVCYPIRVVSAGDFTLPGPSVEGMYNPALHSRRAPGRVLLRR